MSGFEGKVEVMKAAAKKALTIVLLLGSLGAQSSQLMAQADSDAGPVGVIVFIGDGFGPNQYALLQDYREILQGEPSPMQDFSENEALLGLLDTSPVGTVVTDSAASATAMACGVSTLNGRVGMDAGGKSLETALERARKNGWATGLVTSTRMTHATPACYAAHVPSRGMEVVIAQQMIDSGVDLMLGGGARFFVKAGTKQGDVLEGIHRPNEEGSSDNDLVTYAREVGKMTVVGTMDGMYGAPSSGRILGLFSKSHLPYEIDREELGLETVPTLGEMVDFAINRLSARGNFFLMVEGGRIDHAGHANDAATMVKESVAFDDAFGVALDYYRTRPETTSLMVTADHETGGFAVSYDASRKSRTPKQELSWLDRQPVSFEYLASVVGTTPIDELLEEHLGLELSKEELALFEEVTVSGSATSLFFTHLGRQPSAVMAHLISRRTGLIWGTGGHTDAPVFILAAGPGSDQFKGMHSNTKVGEVLLSLVGK